MGFFVVASSLSTAAEAYFYLGWSVIPLLGDLDPSRPKVPAIPWAAFQQRRASLQEQQEWCREGRFAGLGIVTGRVSQLVVLDFDDQNISKYFEQQFPDLMETHIVRSAGRQLPHLYFRLPPHLNLSTMKGQGVDLLSDGCYVVAPPTTINGQAYRIIRGGMPKTLTERDIARIRVFMSRHTAQPTDWADHTKRLVEIAQKPQTPARSLYLQARQVTPHDLARMYSFYCKQGGRNEALFSTSLYARDTGWLPAETQNILIPLHIQQLKPLETPVQRQREAQRTIQSAFSRPARPMKSQALQQQGYLSNSVREALMQQKMTCVIRVIEALFRLGIQPGGVITAKQAVARLSGLIGRDSVLNALRARYDKQTFFTPVSPHHAVATDKRQTDSKNAFLEGSNIQYLIKRGRPEHYYKMPTNEELCAILGVKVTGSDPLEQVDLASAPKTRMALHRELIKRRPGQYPLGWLARRLGVNRRTIATYNHLIPIHSRAMHIDTPITWKTIERLPFDEPIQGAVLVANNGKRYPALRTIASRLLSAGQGITLKQQTVSFYWYGDEEPLMSRLQVQQEVEMRQERVATFMAKQPSVQNILKPYPPAAKPVKSKPTVPKNLHRPLKDTSHEAQALRLYGILNQNGTKHLSLANARRLVATYDSEAIANALNLLIKRQHVANPVGFLVTVLRV